MPPIYEKKYHATIGLEVHAQLKTQSKIFCHCKTQFGAEPNTQVCPVCLGLPGVLPVLNREVLNKAIIAGLATDSTIADYSKFDRKQYFYPDLPKAYQISQYDMPICSNGRLAILDDEEKLKDIGITRIHMEEDAGKLVHGHDQHGQPISFVDLNRTGVPLIEIVSEPDIESPQEAYNYLQSLRAILRYADISDGNMEEGSLRCDANVSVRPQNSSQLGTRCEIKNLNSFKMVRAAIQYEIERQIDIVESGGQVEQETRLWDADKSHTRIMRTKDEAHDYRYFPDPDLVPMTITQKQVQDIRARLPELPEQKIQRFQADYQLSHYDAQVLSADRELADYFESVVAAQVPAKKAANWITSEILFILKEQDWTITDFPLEAKQIAKLLHLVEQNVISGKIAKQVFGKMIAGEGDAQEIVDKEGLKQVTDTSKIEGLVDEVLQENPAQVEEYRSGKTKVFGFLVGQVMKKSKGKANPQMVNELLNGKLEN